MIKKVNHVMFYSQNLAKTAEWYQEKLGFQVSYHAPDAFLSLHSEDMGRLDFHYDEGKENIGKGPLPYFLVQDIEACKSWLEDKGIKVSNIEQVAESPKHCWFEDYEGNALGLEEF